MLKRTVQLPSASRVPRCSLVLDNLLTRVGIP